MAYIDPREAAKVKARKAAAYGYTPAKKATPKRKQGAAAMAAIAKAGK